MQNLHLAQRIFNTPLLLHPAKFNAILTAIGPRILGRDADLPLMDVPEGQRVDPNLIAREAFMPRFGSFDQESGLYVERGVAVIGIAGTLIHNGRWVGAYSGLTSYDGILEQKARADAAPHIQAVLWSIHSFGGEVAGCFDACDQIFAQRGGSKPHIALIADAGTSAAYAIASAFDEAYITQAGLTGSIGVIARHVDLSAALSEMGVTVTEFTSGRKKAQGSPYKPLSDEDKEDFQREIQEVAELFYAQVARNRGITVDDAIKEAAVYTPPKAQAAGLVDGIVSPRELFERLQQSPSFSTAPARAASANATEVSAMTDKDKAAETFTAAQMTEAKATQFEAGKKQGAKDERARIAAILGGENAKGQQDLAKYYAFETGMAPEACEKALEVSAKRTGLLPAAMAGTQQPNVGAEAPAPEGEDAEVAARANRILNAGKPQQSEAA